MDSETLKQLESLLSMFEARDAMWSKHSRQIGAVIQPTVLEALYDLFDTPRDDIEWMDIQVIETILVIVCNIIYDPASTKSLFLQRVDNVQRPETPIQVQRVLRIGVPLAIVFSSKEEIKEYLTKIPVEATDGTTDDDDDDDDDDESLPEYEGADPSITTVESSSPTSPPNVFGFDTSDLSDDQIKRLMLYHHAIEGTKQ